MTAGSDHFRPDVLDLQEQGSPFIFLNERNQRMTGPVVREVIKGRQERPYNSSLLSATPTWARMNRIHSSPSGPAGPFRGNRGDGPRHHASLEVG